MADNNYNGATASLVISDEVIAAIAMNAAKDVDGVAGFGIRPKDLCSTVKECVGCIDNQKHVRVDMSDDEIKLHMYLLLTAPSRIQDVTINVQKAVKAAVQNMTGRVVTKVDVTISGIEPS